MKKPKAIKVFMNGKRLKDIYPHATPFQVFKYRVYIFLRRVVILALIVSAMFGVYKLGGYLNPATIYTTAEVIVEVDAVSPVLKRIARCESPNGHFTNGQVTLGANKNGSVDVGKYQINNALWAKKATEMGLNLMVEKDNEEFAKYLYKNFGTEPWIWSKSCWNK